MKFSIIFLITTLLRISQIYSTHSNLFHTLKSSHSLNSHSKNSNGALSQNQISSTSKIKHQFQNSIESQSSTMPSSPEEKAPAIGVSSSGTTVPDVPVAQGLGGEVYVPCVECTKLMNKFLTKCVDQEANGAQAGTFRAFCEEFYSKKGKKNDFCMNLNAKIAAVTGETGEDIVDATKPPDVCIKFKNECDKNGGGARCYTGFCDQVAECVECPAGLVDLDNSGKLELEVCSANGICKLGWYDDTNKKGGNGYCECGAGAKGLACNQSA